METLLKKPEIKRDAEGRFEQHGTGLIKKTSKNKLKTKKDGNSRIDNIPPEKRQIGRPKGSLNKVTANLKQMILNSLDRVGGEEYLEKLAIENSSAYAGLLGKILPAVLAADTESSGGSGAKFVFERVIVMPDGRRHIEGKTPLQIAPPAVSNDVSTEDEQVLHPNEIKHLDE